MKFLSNWPMVALVLAAIVGLTGCDQGPADVEQVLEGSVVGAGVVLSFDVVVEGALPEGTPLDGVGLRVSVVAQDPSSGGFSSGRVVDEAGFAFDNATVRNPGPFDCDGASCRARLTGFVPGVPGDALVYSIRVTYAPDWDGSSPPDFRIDLVEEREAPVSKVSYAVPLDGRNQLAGAVVQLAAQPPIVDPPIGWLNVRNASIWWPSSPSPAFACIADGCDEASEVVFVNDVSGATVEGWLATEADPVMTIVDRTHSDGAVTETAGSVVDEYRVTIDYSSRDVGLPLMVDLEWAGDESDGFVIGDDYAANRWQATEFVADRCGRTSCGFRVARTNPAPNAGPPSALIVTVLPWESETDRDIRIDISG